MSKKSDKTDVNERMPKRVRDGRQKKKTPTPAEIAKERILQDRRHLMEEITRKQCNPMANRKIEINSIFPRQSKTRKKEALKNIFKSQT